MKDRPPIAYSVEGVESDECPVSCITAESRELIALVGEDGAVNKATGATLFGPVAGRWPAWYWDAVATIQRLRDSEHAAALEAIHSND